MYFSVVINFYIFGSNHALFGWQNALVDLWPKVGPFQPTKMLASPPTRRTGRIFGKHGRKRSARRRSSGKSEKPSRTANARRSSSRRSATARATGGPTRPRASGPSRTRTRSCRRRRSLRIRSKCCSESTSRGDGVLRLWSILLVDFFRLKRYSRLGSRASEGEWG